jgi:hypothetical protein
VSEVSRYYRSDLRVSEAIATASPTDVSWGLGVNYETTVRNVSDTVS